MHVALEGHNFHLERILIYTKIKFASVFLYHEVGDNAVAGKPCSTDISVSRNIQHSKMNKVAIFQNTKRICPTNAYCAGDQSHPEMKTEIRTK